jgi:Arc/MetJ-type ribon-helix-helix transcriptional regulator
MSRFTISMKKFTMTRLTISLDDETETIVEENVGDDGDYESKSEFVRNCIQAHTEVERLRDRLETREERIDELEEQLARRSQLEEKIDTLAKQREEPEPPFFIKWYRWWQRQQ